MTPNIRLFALCAAALLCVATATDALSKRNVALVLGNGGYANVGRLSNPVNDASLVSTSLRTIGFEVTTLVDADRPATEKALLEFSKESAGADVALVFYAGHGIQYQGKNYLLPVDASLDNEMALRLETVDVDLVLQAMGTARTKLLFLDACRNNPFTNRLQLSGGNRSVSRGLARIEAATSGTLIAFSTSPDDVASDGTGANSPFASALARYLKEPGLEIRQVLTRVRAEVINATGNKQTPWENSSLLGDLYLGGRGSSTAQAPMALPTPAPDDAAWERAVSDGSEAALETFAMSFPDSRWTSTALRMIANLQAAAAATSVSTGRPTREQLRAALVGRWELAEGDGFAIFGCEPKTITWTDRDFDNLMMAGEMIDNPFGLPSGTYQYAITQTRKVYVYGDEYRKLTKGFINWDVEKWSKCLWRRASGSPQN